MGWRERDAIKDYIARQEEHHEKKTFKEEYVEFLNVAGVEFDPKYLLMMNTGCDPLRGRNADRAQRPSG
ncbi:MAG: hypothetical protein IPO05_18640 [Flavobacteriales bacterium]|nr:hypothetical protein [Flavobacteriales bacterium]